MNMYTNGMNPKMLPELFLQPRAYRILSFLSLHPDRPAYDKEISEKTGVSRGSTNQILRDFLENGLVSRERRGKMWLYTLTDGPLVRSFRVFENLITLAPLARALEGSATRVILYGSAATGEDTAESDMDLFVISDDPDSVSAAIRKFESDRPITPVIQTPEEYAASQTSDAGFMAEVKRGQILLEKGVDEQRL